MKNVTHNPNTVLLYFSLFMSVADSEKLDGRVYIADVAMAAVMHTNYSQTCILFSISTWHLYLHGERGRGLS